MIEEIEHKKAISEIDKNRLDEECVNFPLEYEKWALKLAEARADLEDTKNVLEVAEAEADLKTRDKEYKWKGIEKVTESAIRSAVTLEQGVREASKEYREAKREVEFINARVNSLDNKKSMLEKIVSLRLASYYSEPQMPKERGNIHSEIQDAKRKKIYKEKLNKVEVE